MRNQNQKYSARKTPVLAFPVFALVVQSAMSQVTYTMEATREGLVGGTTANGTVIAGNMRFCALPSRSVLCAKGVVGPYTVDITYLATDGTRRTSLNVPVWDVGPWSTNDTYWAANRTRFPSIPRGVPASAMDLSDKYTPAQVVNQSGIDLSEMVWTNDLKVTWQNGTQVSVKFNWVTGTTVDNPAATYVGAWTAATSSTDKYGADYRYHSTLPVSETATFPASLTAGNKYNVYAWWPQGANRSTTAGYVVSRVGGTTTVNVNQQINGGKWNLLGNFDIAGGANSVKLSCWTTTGFIVVADAVNWR